MVRFLNIAGYFAMSALVLTDAAFGAESPGSAPTTAATCRLDGQGFPPDLAFTVRAGMGGDPSQMPRVVILPPVGANRAGTARAGELTRAADGLFYIIALINGQPVRFLVDTGASAIVLTRKDALRVGALSNDAAFVEVADTAGGQTRMARVTLSRMTVAGTSGHAVPAVVAGEDLGVSLLGQSWLTQLDSVTIEGDRMVLR